MKSDTHSTSIAADDLMMDLEAQSDDTTTSTEDETTHELHDSHQHQQKKYCAYLRERFELEKELFFRSWKVLLFCILFQYVHSVATNLVYYLHEPADEPLKDLGFMVLPPLDEEDQFVSEVLFFILIAIVVAFAFKPFFFPAKSTEDRFVVVMATRYARVLVMAQSLRILSFLGTVLPSPNYHCATNSASYNPPQNVGEVFFRIDALTGCGDLIFSSHTIFVTLGGLLIHQYSQNKYLKALVWSMVVALGFLIVAARKHYTVDVIVAWYTCPLLWFYCAKTYPDDKPTKPNLPMVEQEQHA